MSATNKYFDKQSSRPEHPRIGAWRSYRKDPAVHHVGVDVWSERQGLMAFAPRLFVSFYDANGEILKQDEAAWEPELERWLIDEEKARAATTDNEKLRFSLLLKPALRPILIRHGDEDFNSVLIAGLREGPCQSHPEVAGVLREIHESQPNGQSAIDCQELIDHDFASTARKLLELYDGDRAAAEDILGGAIARYLDDRFSAAKVAASGETAEETRTLRVAGPVQHAALSRAFDPPDDSPGRIMPATFQRDVRPRAEGRPPAPGTVFGDDWTVLRRVDGPPSKRSPRLPSVRAADVARTVRKALMAAYGAGAPEILSGHGASGAAAERPHLAYVPLPFVAHERADGSILGVALVFPKDTPAEERRAVHRALDAWEKQAARDDDDRWVPVHLGRDGELWLERLGEEALQSPLRAATWCAASRSWASATPLALDRNPGDLRASDPRKQAAAHAEAEATIVLACERLRLPRPARVTVVPAPPLAGSANARDFPPYATGNPPVQRVLVHATLALEAPVRGPLLLGAGRYFGLGLFRPLGDCD